MSDPFLHDQINAAIAESDALAEDFELWKAKRAQREPVTKEFANDLVYKTNENAMVQPQPTMTPEVQAQWNDWFARSFAAHIDPIITVLGEENGRILREELAKLRAEIDTVKRGTRGKKRK